MRHLHADADADADAEHADGSVEANLRLPHEWECVKVTATWGRPGQRWRCSPTEGTREQAEIISKITFANFSYTSNDHKSEGMINWAPCDLSNLAASVASDYCAQLTH